MKLKRGELQKNYPNLLCLLKKKRKDFFFCKLLTKSYFVGWPEKKSLFEGIRRKICFF